MQDTQLSTTINEHTGEVLETFIDEGIPGNEGHWRTLYIRWARMEHAVGDPTGISVEELLDVLLDRIATIHGSDSVSVLQLQGARDVLFSMLQADKYGGPLPDTEYLTNDELAAQGLDAPSFGPPTG